MKACCALQAAIRVRSQPRLLLHHVGARTPCQGRADGRSEHKEWISDHSLTDLLLISGPGSSQNIRELPFAHVEHTRSPVLPRAWSRSFPLHFHRPRHALIDFLGCAVSTSLNASLASADTSPDDRSFRTKAFDTQPPCGVNGAALIQPFNAEEVRS
jgi:hypothetical protein